MKFANPYIAGNPVHGQGKFIGRTDVLRDISRTLHNPSTNAIVLFGQRRIGKTSVLLHVEQQLIAENKYTPIYFDLQNKASLALAEVLYQMARKISLVAQTPLPDHECFDRDGKFFQEMFIPTAVEISNRQGLVLLLDEFDVLDLPQRAQAGTTFFPYLQKWMVNAKGIQFVFVLGRRPEDLSTDTLATFKAIRSRQVSLMTQKDTQTIIRQSEKDGSLMWTHDAVNRVWYWTQGQPYLTQLLCSEIWEVALGIGEVTPPSNKKSDRKSGHSPVMNAADVDAAVNRTLEQGANAFQWIWNGLPPAERVVMAAMAETRGEYIDLDELADILNRSKVRLILRELEIAPETLIRWDLLRPANKGFRFAIPLLRRWVAEEKPLRRVKAELDSLEPLAESLYRSGEGFYKMGSLDEAQRLLQNALNVNPNHFRARLLLGQVLIGRGNPREAVEELEPAYRFDPRSAQPGFIGALLALAETQSGSEQLATYNRILELEPEQITALKKKRAILSGVAKMALKRGNFDIALTLYQQVGDREGLSNVKLHKEKLAKRVAIARKNEETEDWSVAVTIYEKLLQEFPDRKDWQDRLKTAQTQKKLAEAYLRAYTALQKGKKDLAQTLFGRVVGIQPDYKDALRYLLLVVKGIDIEELLKECRQARAHQQTEDLGGNVILEMVSIPGGTFLMGAADTEEGWFCRESPQHEVTVAPFFMAKYPVTQEQWKAVMGNNPSRFEGTKRPVENVSWYDAMDFCERLSQKTGRAYRLPSEGEWEYACRAGTTTPFHFGGIITSELANYDGTRSYVSEPTGKYRGETTDIGGFPPNGFGLYEMHGNVWEWCADPWHENYDGAPSHAGTIWESQGTALSRILRGGAWNILPAGCRSAFRDWAEPNTRNDSYGLRVALTSSTWILQW